MPSFQTTISPTKRAAARFVLTVRRALQQALVEEQRKRGLTQSDIARELGVHRSVINRELRGERDIGLSRIAELAYIMGRKPTFALPERRQRDDANIDGSIPLKAGPQEKYEMKLVPDSDSETIKMTVGANAA